MKITFKVLIVVLLTSCHSTRIKTAPSKNHETQKPKQTSNKSFFENFPEATEVQIPASQDRVYYFEKTITNGAKKEVVKRPHPYRILSERTGQNADDPTLRAQQKPHFSSRSFEYPKDRVQVFIDDFNRSKSGVYMFPDIDGLGHLKCRGSIAAGYNGSYQINKHLNKLTFAKRWDQSSDSFLKASTDNRGHSLPLGTYDIGRFWNNYSNYKWVLDAPSVTIDTQKYPLRDSSGHLITNNIGRISPYRWHVFVHSRVELEGSGSSKSTGIRVDQRKTNGCPLLALDCFAAMNAFVRGYQKSSGTNPKFEVINDPIKAAPQSFDSL